MRIALVFAAVLGLASGISTSSIAPVATSRARESAHTYIGFDRNDYPGDDALDVLRKAFAFSGYWLNAPPGEASTNWIGKRGVLTAHGFGFLVLFNGRLEKELKAARAVKMMGTSDANTAVSSAHAEGFPRGTVIFVDQEEGGRLLPEQREYLYAWIDGVNAAGYRAGVYCSGMPDQSDNGVITADDLRQNAGARQISFFVYNDACLPSPGCVFSPQTTAPTQSGVPFAAVWQIAQSPRRKNITARCRATYAADGNCYPPGLASQKIYVDVDIAASGDPSGGR
jgi:hypothetical protein